MAEKELQQYKTLLQITNAIISQRTREGLFREITTALQPIFGFVHISILLNIPGADSWDYFSPAIGIKVPGFPTESFPVKRALIPSQAMTEKKTIVVDMAHEKKYPESSLLLEAGLPWAVSAPLIIRSNVIGSVQLCFQESPKFLTDHIEFFERIVRQLSLAIDNMIAYEKLQSLKDVLAEEKQYLKKEIELLGDSGDIIFASQIMSSIMETIADVATTDATVLITGETGTGKDLVARKIHALSSRSTNTFIKINCAALVPTLIESELFGHEKGSFTGATARKIGRFELAHTSTLFLDEISELPLNTQAKLLQVLQEGCFERVGGSETIKTNVRIIAATNRDLRGLVRENKFRDDLYYRLNIFPIHIPPLRERTEDIPLLGAHFMDKFCSKLSRIRPHFLQDAIDLLVHYQWPGNVRELENFIERIIILKSNKPVAATDLRQILNLDTDNEPDSISLQEIEKRHIDQVLRRTKGVIAGPHGAAHKLNIKRSTLKYRLKKHGLHPADYR